MFHALSWNVFGTAIKKMFLNAKAEFPLGIREVNLFI